MRKVNVSDLILSAESKGNTVSGVDAYNRRFHGLLESVYSAAHIVSLGIRTHDGGYRYADYFHVNPALYTVTLEDY